MANTNPITRWLLSKKDLFQLSITQYGWTDKYLPLVYDFTAQIEFGAIKVCGRGTDFNSETSIEKASAEAIERYLCKKLKMTSTGLSVSGRSSSLEHARNEALERFYLSSHLELRQPLARFPDTIIEAQDIMSIVKEFKDRTSPTFVSFHQMSTPSNDYGIVCFIEETKSNIFSFGFSYGQNFEYSLQSAFLEAVPNFIALKENRELSTVGFQTLSRDNRPWHLSDKFHSQLTPLLLSDHSIGTANLKSFVEYPNLDVTEINVESLKELSGCPIVPVKVVTKSGGTLL